jgi:aldehyde dehydrogenase (NAD+)
VVGSVPKLGAEDAARAITLAAAAGPAPSRYERGQVLLRAAARIEGEAEQVARLITWESGLCLKDTRHEVQRTLDVLRFAAAEALRDDGQCFSFDTSAHGRARRGYTLREPLRVVSAITPFNHPLNQVAHKVAPAIAVGSPLVLKPSERTPLSALYLASVLHEAGLPPGRLSVVTGDPRELGPVLINHPDVELVAFTGGVSVGKHIAAQLGYRRALLELGGNDPLIVLEDADLEEAVRLAVSGCYRNSGQRCTAVKRLLVVEPLADAFAARFTEASAALKVGDPHDASTDVGTVISEEAARELEERARRTLADGATLLYGNRREGALFWPTVMDHVRPTSESVRTETFGPHAPILRVRDADEALRVANDTPYGLSAGVCTNDLTLAHRFVRELRCGTVNIREVPGYRSEATPFGGIKDSGTGVKEGVLEAMKAMSFTKLYTLPWP